MEHLPVRRILVPVDLSLPQHDLQEYAVALAAQLSAELLFFTVIDSPTTLALIENHPSSGTGSVAGFRAKLAEDAKVLLKRMVDRAGQDGVRATGHAVVSERVGQEVIREAGERQVDLILLAAEQHSVLVSFLFGDSAEVIQHLAPCPVLTIKPHDAGA